MTHAGFTEVTGWWFGPGEAAGLGTALCWVFTSYCFATAGRQLGAGTVNLIRSGLALPPLLLLAGLLTGSPWPQASSETILWLALSGVVGLAIGDQFLFAALVEIGPRLTVLLMTLAPVFAAILGLAMLGEVITPMGLVGMAITLTGIAWVVAERPTLRVPADGAPSPHLRGVVFALLAAASQGFGVVLAKQGMIGGAEEVAPISAQVVRMLAGLLALLLAWSLFGPRRWMVGARRSGPLRLDRRGWTGMLGGTLLGPVVGVWLSLISVRLLEAGVASTLMAMTPVLVLPFSRWIDRERIGLRAGLGAAIAVAGVAVLALSDSATAPEAATTAVLETP